MSKTKKYIPDLRIRKPYKREPKLKVNVPPVPLELEDTDVDVPVFYDWNEEHEEE